MRSSQGAGTPRVFAVAAPPLAGRRACAGLGVSMHGRDQRAGANRAGVHAPAVRPGASLARRPATGGSHRADAGVVCAWRRPRPGAARALPELRAPPRPRAEHFCRQAGRSASHSRPRQHPRFPRRPGAGGAVRSARGCRSISAEYSCCIRSSDFWRLLAGRCSSGAWSAPSERGAAPARAAAQLGAQRWASATSPSADPIEARRTWRRLNARLRHAQDAAARPSILAAAVLRAQRPALQSAMLGLGAYLVMIGACHPAGMLAASIMLTRVLGPLEMAIVHWRSFAVARQSASPAARTRVRPPPAIASLQPSSRARRPRRRSCGLSCDRERTMRVAPWAPARDRRPRACGPPPSSGSRPRAPDGPRTRCADRPARRRASWLSRP